MNAKQLSEAQRRLGEVLRRDRTRKTHASYFDSGGLVSDTRYVERHALSWLDTRLRDNSFTVEKRLLITEALEDDALKVELQNNLFGLLKDDGRVD